MVVRLQSDTAPALGRLSRVDVREVWTNEAVGFTPWLAQEENLRLLAETITMQLILEAKEKHVGMFRADILACDVHTGHLVLIENQLERTDHGHLGQLLTYAAGLKAVSIVWVSTLFTDEHRAALDWLNEITNSSISFYGLEMELWRIDDSVIAPKFNLVSKPNMFSKRVSERLSEPVGSRVSRFLWEQANQGRKPSLTEIMHECHCSRNTAIRYRRQEPHSSEPGACPQALAKMRICWAM
jgi:hypothetical protein